MASVTATIEDQPAKTKRVTAQSHIAGWNYLGSPLDQNSAYLYYFFVCCLPCRGSSPRPCTFRANVFPLSYIHNSNKSYFNKGLADFLKILIFRWMLVKYLLVTLRNILVVTHFFNCVSEESHLIFKNYMFKKTMKEKGARDHLVLIPVSTSLNRISCVEWNPDTRQTESILRHISRDGFVEVSTFSLQQNIIWHKTSRIGV